MDEIERLGVKIGDWVQVERGGDVIPKVAKVIDDKDHPRGTKEFDMPEKCPVCGTKVVRTEGEVDYRCVNANCPAKLFGTILHFASRGVMNIDGMGDVARQATHRERPGQECRRHLRPDEKKSAQPGALGRQVRAEYSRRDREFEESPAGARDLRSRHPHGRRAHCAISG